MKRFLLIAIISFICSLSLHSQDVVISEYFNVPSGSDIKETGEWAELVVIRDGISMAGWKIRDNSTDGEWMPAFQFKDIPLWKNLHEGTIIVIYFKTAPTNDDDKSDGYIQVGAEDTKYFTYLGSNPNKSLNLNQTNDMVQILDASDTPIHTFGHAKSDNNSAFQAVPGSNKLCYSDEITPNTSVAVLPGAKLSDYDAGYDDAQKNTIKFSISECSPGLPNKSAKYPTSNIDFWRGLRQPKWNNAKFSTSDPSSPGKVILTWAPIAADANDPVEGYLLLRAEAKTWPVNSLPTDSKIYNAGDKIGSAIVIGHIQKLSSGSYTDNTDIKCGKTYTYALVAYRYGADDFGEDQNKKELSARGRAYNETNFAKTNPITIDEPQTPVIYTVGKKYEICKGDELTIFLKDTNDYKNCNFQWVKDGNDITGETNNKLIVTQSGNYSITVINTNGCESTSTSLKITVLSAPIVVIQEDKGSGQLKTFQNDTTIYLCNGSSLKLVSKIVGNSDTIQWLKNGSVVQEGPTKYSLDITTGGTYQVFAFNGICSGKSIIVTVKILEVNLRISPTSLTLDYDKNPIGTILITNLTDYELVLQAGDIILPAGFTIINPATAPYTIPARDFLNLDIKYDVPDFKIVTGKMELNPQCGTQYTVDLTGIRKKPNSTYPVAELTDIDFGIVPNCMSKDTSFLIRMEGNDVVILKSDKNKDKYKGYEVEFNPILPCKLNDGDVRVYIAFSNTIPGVYDEDIILNYTVDGEDSDEPIKISLHGEKQVPKLEVLDDYKKYQFQLFGCENTLDTILRVTNQSAFDITIKKNFTANQIQFKTLPQVIHPKDTVDLPITLTAGIYPPTTFTYEPCSVQSDSIAIEISALAPDMEFDIPNNTIDFGIIDNCQFSTDSIIKIGFSGNGIPSSIKDIYIPNGIQINGINIGENIPTGGGQFDVILKSDFLGLIDDNIEITLTPCDIKKVINVKGARFTPQKPLVSDTLINFGDFILGDPYIEKILSITNNDTHDINIKDIQGIAAPFVLVNNDLPYLLKAGETKGYAFRYETSVESNLDISNIKIIYDTYCDFNTNVELMGKSSLGILPANIKLSIPNNITIGLGQTVKVPVNIQVTDTTTLAKCGIKNVKFGIQYNARVLEIANAKAGNAIKSQISSFSFVHKSLGYDEISFDISPNYDITAGNLAELEILGLLGDTTQTAIAIKSPELSSDLRTINIEIENGNVQVIGQCPLNNRIIRLDGQKGGILAVEPNPVTDNVSITIEVISDELTQCGIYDYLGKSVKSIINENLKPKIYNCQVNVNELVSGVYFIVFKNGIIINTTKLIIKK